MKQIAEALETANRRYNTDPIAKISLFVSLFTVITTIALGTIGALFLYNKQAETNIKFSLAHLAFDVPPAITCPSKIMLGCLAELQVTNVGPAEATGVTVDVFIKDISPTWSTSINDMNNFTVTTLPSVVKVLKNQIYDPDPAALAKVVKHNAYELTITNLPPNNLPIQVYIGLSPNVPVVTGTLNINTTLYVASQNAQAFNFGTGFPTNQVIQKYFDHFFSIADFEVNATCQNCTNDPVPLVSSTSSLNNDTLTSLLSPQNLIDSIWSGSITVTYERPKRSSLPEIGKSLYLWTQPVNPTNPLDSSTRIYSGVVTSCLPTGQSGGSQDTCTPNPVSGGGVGGF